MALTPQEGHSANLGVAPCALRQGGNGEPSVYIPAVPGEAAWLGFVLPAGSKLPIVVSDGRSLKLVVVGTSGDGQRFVRSGVFGGADGGDATLAFGGPHDVSRMTVRSVSLDMFNARFGFAWQPALSPGTYPGWRLP